MAQLWRRLLQIGLAHGVNPWVFGVLYLAHHPLFWGTMAWLGMRVRRRRPVAGVVALGVFFWFLPYTYLFVFGRGLPLWVYVILLVLLAAAGPHVVREIRRRLGQAAGPPS